MKFKTQILLTFVIFTGQFCFAQDIPGSILLKSRPPLSYTITPLQPYYILKADGKSTGLLDTSSNGVLMNLDNTFNLKAIDPELIKQIDVIKGQKALDQYGDLGMNGVIIITFKSYDNLPKEIKDRFRETKE